MKLNIIKTSDHSYETTHDCETMAEFYAYLQTLGVSHGTLEFIVTPKKDGTLDMEIYDDYRE